MSSSYLKAAYSSAHRCPSSSKSSSGVSASALSSTSFLPFGANSDPASASCTATPSKDHQRSDHASCTERRSSGCTLRTLSFACCRTSSTAVSCHRPPTSQASTTSSASSLLALYVKLKIQSVPKNQHDFLDLKVCQKINIS